MKDLTINTEVIFLDDTNERFGTIEYINNDIVHINGLDGTLYITNVQSILYPLLCI
jgi:hypothetical protein